jgi:hypothetical protein
MYIILLPICDNFQTEAKQKELQQKRERMWNEWQPPKSEEDSDSDLTDDDEINTDVDLKKFVFLMFLYFEDYNVNVL